MGQGMERQRRDVFLHESYERFAETTHNPTICNRTEITRKELAKTH